MRKRQNTPHPPTRKALQKLSIQQLYAIIVKHGLPKLHDKEDANLVQALLPAPTHDALDVARGFLQKVSWDELLREIKRLARRRLANDQEAPQALELIHLCDSLLGAGVI